MTLPQHSSLTDQHFTPSWLVNACMSAFHKTLFSTSVGTLLDPASSELANTFIQADKIFTKEDDGLIEGWEATTVFCNPPGGKTGSKSNQNLWAEKFCYEYDKPDGFFQGVFIAFNPELLFRIGKLWVDSKVVMLSKRVHYLSEYEDGILKEGQWSEVEGFNCHDTAKCLKQNREFGKSNTLIFDKKDTGCRYSLRVDRGVEESDMKFYKWTDAPTHSTALVFKGVTGHNIRRAFADIDHTMVELAD